jgi:hypothetical protein
MNRGLGATTVGAAAVLAGAMVHIGMPRTVNSSGGGATLQHRTGMTEKAPSGEGPWTASCKYWTESRWGDVSDPKGSPELHVTLNENDRKFGGQFKGFTEGAKSECDSLEDAWGIPPSPSAKPDVHEPDVRTIIATVPDPIHSHFALAFDRTIDALMQAAADNRYLGSTYWLPWRSLPVSASTEPSINATQTEETRKREQQPGLIILKYNPREDEKKDLEWSDYHRVVYLFLVGESPELGVDGDQLRNALRYEAVLQKKHHARLSMGNDHLLSIIGPRWSGSAASLREGIDRANFDNGIAGVVAAGMTSTQIAADELNSRSPTRPISYVSFGENATFEADQLAKAFSSSSPNLSELHVAVLTEDNTVFGESSAHESGKHEPKLTYIRFPREISLLRNAEIDQSGKSTSTSEPPSPYLSLSLKDTNADDTVSRFSTTQTPLSQEAQLMAIAHQLQRDHTDFILVTASNILDELFLAQFLRRALPDARLVFYNGEDRLVERDVDNAQYIGSISVTPFNLSSLENFGSSSRAFPDSQSEGIYNAASYIFWRGSQDWKQLKPLMLAGYLHGSMGDLQAPLWATAVGSDGYYPLGILNPCASDSLQLIPSIYAGLAEKCGYVSSVPEFMPAATDSPPIPRFTATAAVSYAPTLVPESVNAAPSLLWSVLCVLVTFLSIGHTSVIWSAQYWSPFTRDLAVCQNDQPRRRTVYINIGTAMLFCIAFVTAFPMIAVAFPRYCPYLTYSHNDRSLVLAFITLLAGLGTAIVTFVKTRHYLKRSKNSTAQSPSWLYPIFNWVAFISAVVIPLIWTFICLRNNGPGLYSCVGIFFSYRSLHPGSGVSPVVPVLFLLLGWYLWAIFQTARLRFSTLSRPRLPRRVGPKGSYPFFIADCDLEACESPINSCLFENITCLLITHEIVRRFTGWKPRVLNWIFSLVCLGLFIIGIVFGRIQSLERFLHAGRWPTLYEALVAALFFPLLVIALTGWLRMICIWGSLSRGVLEPLERLPIRFAFNRVNEVGWVTMLTQSSLHIRWRDMARSGESVRQLLNNSDLQEEVGDPSRWQSMSDMQTELVTLIMELRERIGAKNLSKPKRNLNLPPNDDDLPDTDHGYDLGYIYEIETRYAKFCELLLEYVLIPRWKEKRIGFVDDHGDSSDPEIKAKCETDAPKDPLHIRLAEELIAVRYIALIRSVLVNIRYLMMFISSAFVFAIIAWNSYPFQPHRLIDWGFTILLVFLGIGLVTVFAQMHRNAILSRITDTTPNKLGWNFYVRIVTFGAVPVLTWFAYQFPEVGGSLFKILQPSLQVIK